LPNLWVCIAWRDSIVLLRFSWVVACFFIHQISTQGQFLTRVLPFFCLKSRCNIMREKTSSAWS
jgi:hypothetical protein